MEFRILGPLEVTQDGRTLELGATKQQTLLAVLLLHAGEIVSPTRLMTELWGEDPPSTAAKGVQGYVSSLRRILGADAIATRAHGYVLAPEHLDAAAVRAPGRRGALPRRAGAVARRAAARRRARGPGGRRGRAARGAAARRARAADRGRPRGRPRRRAGRRAAASWWRRIRCASACARSSCSRSTAPAARPTRWRSTATRGSFLADELGLEPGEELRRLQRLMLDQDAELDAPARPRRRSPRRSGAGRTRARRQARRRPRRDGRGERLDPESLHAQLDRCATRDRAPRRHRRQPLGRVGDRDLRDGAAARGRRAARRARRRRAARRRRRASASTRARCSSAPARAARRSRPARPWPSPPRWPRRAAPRRGAARRAARTGSSQAAVTAERRPATRGGWRRSASPPRSRSGRPRPRSSGASASSTQLRDALAAARRERAVRLLAVVGPPGIGKSRLAHEASAELRRARGQRALPQLRRGARVSPAGGDRRAARGRRAAARRRRAGRRDPPPPARRHRALRRAGQGGGDGLGGAPAVRGRRARAPAGGGDRRRPLGRAGAARPRRLPAAFSSGAAILLVCLGRPELLERRPSWAAPQRGALVLGLDALDEIDALALVGAARRPGARGAPDGRARRRQPAVPRAAGGDRRGGRAAADRRGRAGRAARPARRGRAHAARARRRRGQELPPRRARGAAGATT